MDKLDKLELRPLEYRIEVKDVIHISVDFVIPVAARYPEKVSNALKILALYLGRGSIELVKHIEGPRCFWCGVAVYERTKNCGECGTLLQE